MCEFAIATAAPGSAASLRCARPADHQRGRRDVAREAARGARDHQLCRGVERRRRNGARRHARSRPGTRRSGRSVARPADHRQGLDRRRRVAVHRRVRGVSRSDARCRRHGRGADPRGRCDRARQDDGVRGQRALRAGPQPTRSDPFARRLEQRLGGRGRRRRLSPGARKRLGGEHPRPGRVVRRAWAQAVGRTRADDRSLPRASASAATGAR